MPDVERLTAADFDEAMDLLNLVFSMSSVPHDFASLLPKLYRRDSELMRANLAIRLDGRIRAIVGVFPMEISVAGRKLLAGGIGGVATHPRETGAGLMRRLMTAALSEMRTAGCAISVLGGRRQRYAHYGYEKAGSSLDFVLSKHNIRHYGQGHALPEYRLLPFDTGCPAGVDPVRDGTLARMKAWHDADLCHVCRSAADFPLILSSWQARTWLALDAAGEPAAYLVVSKDGSSVTELKAAAPEHLLPVAAAWVRQQSADAVHLALKPWELASIRQFSRICESWSISTAYNVNILDWPPVLESYLRLKAIQADLADGILHLQIIRPDRALDLRLAVEGREVACTAIANADAVDAGSRISLDDALATRLVFGPLPPAMLLPADLPVTTEASRLLNSWFPLPFAWPGPDQI